MSVKQLSQMSAKELLAYYQAKLDEEARQAKANGKLVCWSASVAPPELCVAMTSPWSTRRPTPPASGARKGALDMLEVADRLGYNVDCCSYGRVNIGYMELLKEEAMTGKTPEVLANSPAARVPLPDLVITCNNICNTLLKWYENLAAELYVYLFLQPHHACLRGVQGLHRRSVPQRHLPAGGHLRPAFDYEKFHAVRQQTQRSIAQWNRIATMSQYKPSPLNGFDLFNYMALVVCARSRDYAEITFRKFADELEEKYKKGESAFKGAEKNRVAWEGIAVWPYLGHTFKTLKNQGSIMTGSAYPNIWDLTYDAEDETLHSMAEAYTRTYINTCLDNKVKVLRGIMDRGKCDGVVYHLNRSCKLMSFLNVETAELIQQANGLPYVSFDGDQTDPRNFAPAQYDTRVEALGEMMDQAAQTAGE